MDWHKIFCKPYYPIAMLILGMLLLLTPLTGGAQEMTPEDAEIKKAEAEATEDRPTFDFSVDILSQYIFRGVAFSRDSAVFQPSVTIGYKGFAANIWGNFDTNERNPFGATAPNRNNPKWNETDFTVSYSREVLKGLTLTGGVIYYALDSNNSTDDSVEIFGGFGYKIPKIDVGIGFAFYREVSHFPGWYLEWYVERSFPLPFAKASLDLYASWSAELSEDNAVFPTRDGSKYQNLHAGQLRAAVNFPVGKHFTISPKIIYWYALGGDSTFAIRNLSWDDKHNHILGGVTVAASF